MDQHPNDLAYIRATVDYIKRAVDKMNGSVADLEDKTWGLQKQVYLMAGALGVLATILVRELFR